MFSSKDENSFTVNRLQTMILWIQDPITKTLEPIRCLADTGASHSFLEAKKAIDLHLTPIESRRMSISAFGKKWMPRVGIVQTSTFGTTDSHIHKPLNMTFLTVDNICSFEPSSELSVEQWDAIKKLNINLADPQATRNGSIPIDAIIGQDLYYSLVQGETILLPGGLRLVPTVYNKFMLAGSSTYMLPLSDLKPNTQELSTTPLIPSHGSNFATFDTQTDEEELYNQERFSRLDILGITPEEDVHPVMDHFEKTVNYVEGRWQVELPKKTVHLAKLPPNFSQAFSRTIGGLKKRRKNIDQTEFIKYNEAMSDYIAKGILEEVASLGSIEEIKKQLLSNPNAFDRVGVDSEDTPVCYLPHFGVYKPSTGKLRVVYDAKARPCKGTLSLNDCLETGPNLMNALARILIRFRKSPYAAKADIEKAFLQVGIHLKDRDLLRIIWIIDGQVKVYRFTRLPFGLNCSPFLLGAVMRHTLFNTVLDDETRDQILSSFYVDDSVSSEKTLEDLLRRRSNSIDAFKEAGMPLRDWNSNDPDARDLFSTEENGRELPKEESVLGMYWNMITDTIGVNDERALELLGKLPKTKRIVWRFLHKLYDPLGLIAPYTLYSKILEREVSKQVKGWDTKIPAELAKKVTDWMEDFVHLKDFRLPRCTEVKNPIWKKLVGFCDASGKGIAVCVYVVSSDGIKTESHLIKANTQLPKERLQSNIPRLELIGATMLSLVMSELRKSYPEVPSEHIHYFTDSEIVLCWIYSGAIHSDTFIAKHVDGIRNLTDIKQWRHVSSGENPADIPSRGCYLAKLKDMPKWKHGPGFIREDMIDHKSTVSGYDAIHTMEIPPGAKAEIKPRVQLSSLHVDSFSPHVLISKVMNINAFSTYHKLMTTTEMMLEFINKLDQKRSARSGKPTLLKHICIDYTDSSKLRRETELLWIRATQITHFPGIQLLVRNPEASVSPAVKSVFFQHGVFLDPESLVLRCTSRLQNSNLPLSTVYPMLLPTQSTFTDLYILHAHEKVEHNKVPQTLTYTRKEFWILKGRKAVSVALRRCVDCSIVEGKCFPLPPWPPLPGFRTQRSSPFSATGLDYTGPFLVWDNGMVVKVYVLLLTCAASRCVHLEVARSMGVDDFLLALERFFSFRGLPSLLVSDNGSNFIRANRELKFVLKSKRAQQYFDQKRITWEFYTEKSPHMGGFIEKLNDIYKRASRKSFGRKTLNFEQFRTMIAYSMAVMNDRPLTYVYSTNSSEGLPLTPSKLTIGHDTLEPPHIRFEALKDDISKKHGDQFVELENSKNEFWKDWNDAWLTGLQEQNSNTKKGPHFLAPKIGDVCLLKQGDDKHPVPRRQWRLCRVIGFKKPKRDNHIRQCKVKTLSKTGRASVLNRSPQFLVPLEVAPHVIDDPMVQTYLDANSFDDSGKEQEALPKFQSLPPFWSQKVNLPQSVFKKSTKQNKGNKNKRKFRSKGKVPKITTKQDTPKIDNSLDILSQEKEEKSGKMPKDPTWKQHKVITVAPSTRVLRPRTKK